MHKSPAFSMDDLARLIENYPREHYSLVKTGAKGAGKLWREGDIGNLTGREVIEEISRGGLWLNMRDVGSVDSRYRKLVDQMFEEICDKVPGFEMPKGHQESILISSPDAQVYYHADLPGQSLVQIAGRKRVYVYPNTAPFITDRITSRTSRCSMSRSIFPTRTGTTITPRCSTSAPARCWAGR